MPNDAKRGLEWRKEPFENRFRVFDEDTHVTVTDTKEFEFDGYKGKLVKETKLFVTEFEKVPVRVGEADE